MNLSILIDWNSFDSLGPGLSRGAKNAYRISLNAPLTLALTVDVCWNVPCAIFTVHFSLWKWREEGLAQRTSANESIIIFLNFRSLVCFPLCSRYSSANIFNFTAVEIKDKSTQVDAIAHLKSQPKISTKQNICDRLTVGRHWRDASEEKQKIT